ncbi:MAG TPA: N-acetyltransferase [Planctomycetaceae bacterium]|nr:N-acetyltransferase [Planctomycetaceae bacterium]
MSTLVVRRVNSSRDIDSFIRVPAELYDHDPHWVAPLHSEVRARLSPQRNPYFQHAQAAMFLAVRDGKAVGRITAQCCELAQKYQRPGDGHFGFYECEASQETSAALFSAALQWLKELGMKRMTGPFSLSIHQEAGLLVDGFHRPPFVFMGHNLPRYQQDFLASGLTKEIDLFAYHLDISKPYPERINRILALTNRDSNINLRNVNKRRIRQEIGLLLEIFNEAWEDNWGHVPMTDAEVGDLANLVKRLFTEDAILLAEIDGFVVGFIVVIPNLNELTRDLKGRLMPLGWLKLLYRIQFTTTGSVRVPLMGIRKQFQNTRTGAAIAFSMIDRCRQACLAKGVKHCEMSWILESNTAMRGILEASGSQIYKTYRIYSKALA